MPSRRIPKIAAPDGKKRPSAPQLPPKSQTRLKSQESGQSGRVSRPLGPLAVERARLLAEQADRAARINRQEAGELLPAAAVAREWAGICAEVRTALLAVPARLAAAHPGHPALIASLEAELRDALAALADDAL